MESGEIPDIQITATNQHTMTAAAHYARLNNQEGAGAWCHPTVPAGDTDEYLQVFSIVILIYQIVSVYVSRNKPQTYISEMLMLCSFVGQQSNRLI